VGVVLPAPVTACRSSPRLDAARGPAALEDDDEEAPFEVAGAFGFGSPGVVTFWRGAGSGGLPNGPEPGSGLLGW
jgi:hypothetical protein